MITNEKLQKALTYLAETDDKCAKAKSYMKGKEYAIKTVKAIAYLESEGTQGDKKEKAYASDEYNQAVEELTGATYDYETMANRRKTAELIVEVWRSMNANRRQGNI